MSWLTDLQDEAARRSIPGTTPPSPAGDFATEQIAHSREFYQQNFLPELLNLREIGLGMGAGSATDGAANGIARAKQAYANADESFARDQMRAGRTVDASTDASQKRRLGLARIIAQVDAGNRGIDSAGQIQRTALDAGTQSYGDLISGGGSILSNIAAMETERNSQITQARTGYVTGSARNAANSIGSAVSAFI